MEASFDPVIYTVARVRIARDYAASLIRKLPEWVSKRIPFFWQPDMWGADSSSVRTASGHSESYFSGPVSLDALARGIAADRLYSPDNGFSRTEQSETLDRDTGIPTHIRRISDRHLVRLEHRAQQYAQR